MFEMKGKKILGIVVLSATLGLATFMPVMAHDFPKPFGTFYLNSNTSVEADVHYLPKTTYFTAVQFNTITKTGRFYIGFKQKLADGTYGGKASQYIDTNVSGKAYLRKFDLHGNYYKEFITGYTAEGQVKEVRLSNNQ